MALGGFAKTSASVSNHGKGYKKSNSYSWTQNLHPIGPCTGLKVI